MPNPKEGSPSEIPRSYIEVTEPLRLPSDRNFYDQFPFREVFADVAAQHGGQNAQKPHIDGMAPDIAFFVSRLLTSAEKASEKGGSSFDRGSHLHSLVNTRLLREEVMTDNLREKYPKSEGTYDKVWATAITSVFKKLAPYPEWQTYVTAYHGQGKLYRLDGSPSYHASKTKSLTYPPSYMAWWDERRALHQRINTGIRMQVVAEAFPQDLQGKSVADAVSNFTGAPETKTWRLTKNQYMK